MKSIDTACLKRKKIDVSFPQCPECLQPGKNLAGRVIHQISSVTPHPAKDLTPSCSCENQEDCD